MISLKKPVFNEEISLQTAEQARFFADEEKRAKIDGDLTFKWYDLERQGTDCSLPLPVAFSWTDDEKNGQDTAAYYLLISEREDMRDPLVYVTEKRRVDVYNLKVGTTYFWQVQKNGKRSEKRSFTTKNTLPRCIKIDGISNVRDMGGYAVKNGRIRQGLVYRGGEFESHMHLSKTGAQDLLRLNIRTEIDMRGEAKGKVDYTTAEALGIKRVFVPSVPNADVFKTENRASLKPFYKTFANAKNYPIYYHCWGGADRTGTAAFILGAFLGMRREELIDEYEFTSLSIWGIRTRNFGAFCDFLSEFDALLGNTMQEKAETFLKEYAGLSDKDLAVIYNVLIEKE